MSNMLMNLDRMKVLFELSLINAPEETIYNKLTVFASEAIGAPVSLVSMVASDYQYFKSQVGLADPWRSSRRTPLSHSFCQHVVKHNKPLIVSDARENDLVKRNLAIRDLGVIGYLGIPLTLDDGKSLGSFCVIDTDVRDWTETEIEIMQELASVVTKEFDARAYVLRRKMTRAELQDLQERIMSFVDSIDAKQDKTDILQEIRAKRIAYDLI